MEEPKILYVDNHLLAIEKPSGWLTQPTQEIFGKSIEEWGKGWLKTTFQKPGNVFLHAVHRLDRPASGIVLCARTSKALSRLQQAIRERGFQKTYLAIVRGSFTEKEGSFTDWIVHSSHHAVSTTEDDKKGKKSTLNYRVLKEENPYTLVEVALDTGRYHQIRLQFSTRGYPLLGDRKYGSQDTFISPHAIALHHTQLHILHPIQQTHLLLQSFPPEDWPIRPSADLYTGGECRLISSSLDPSCLPNMAT